MNITLRMQTVSYLTKNHKNTKITKNMQPNHIYKIEDSTLPSSEISQFNYQSNWILFFIPASQKLYIQMTFTNSVVGNPSPSILLLEFMSENRNGRASAIYKKNAARTFSPSNRNFKKIYFLSLSLSFNHKYNLEQKPIINLISWGVSGI